MNTKYLFFCVALVIILTPLTAQAQSLNYTTSWIGSTFGGSHAPGKPRKHVSLATDALFVMPYDGKKDLQVYIKAMCVAGDYVFAVESRNPERVFVYEAHTGALQGAMQPDETVGKNRGWVDTPYGIRAARRANGEYLIFVEEDLDAKVLLYRWTPGKKPL